MSAPILVVGELIVDFAVTSANGENKLRLGGVAHAARGLWAIGARFAIAAISPRYLRDMARSYLESFGCVEFIELGEVSGAPNVMVIADPIEVSDPGYENLLRDQKTVTLNDVREVLSKYENVLIFPGAFDLDQVCQMLPDNSRLHIDLAYDVRCVSDLSRLAPAVETIFISTSSELFLKLGSDGIKGLSEGLTPLSPEMLVLKENRGGARIVCANDGTVQQLPAILNTTANSIGVGDAFSAAFVAFLPEGSLAAGLKATRVGSAYAQTTSPDVFKTYVERSLRLTVEQMGALGGVSLPWEDRPKHPIYLAAPDFSYADRRVIDEALRCLEYHNFAVRRPVEEHGELPPDADIGALSQVYRKDIELLAASALVFAVPTNRDPGTLVEIGFAIQLRIPVVVYDSGNECRNTMVMAGATCYSQSMDECLNAVFTILSDVRVPSRDA